MPTEEYLQELREAASPLTWSRGVQFSREADFFEESKCNEEMLYMVRNPGQQVSLRVKLWPEDLDWSCDCVESDDPCYHVIGLSIFIKNDGLGRKLPENDSAKIIYKFEERNGKIALNRFIKKNNEESPLTRTLVDLVGGINSGRIHHSPVALTQRDYSVDGLLNPDGEIKNVEELMPLLKQIPGILFKGEPIEISAGGIEPQVHIVDEKRGFRIETKPIKELKQRFANRIVLTTNNQITFLKKSKSKLNSKEKALVAGDGMYFDLKDAPTVMSEVIPLLRRKIQVHIETQKLPRTTKEKPYVILETNILEDRQTLHILPKLLYGKPPLAEIVDGALTMLQSEAIPTRNQAAETELIQKLRQELYLVPGKAVQLEKEVVFKRVELLKRWEISGSGIEAFIPRINLELKIQQIDEENWTAVFESSGISLGSASGHSKGKTVNPSAVLSAWEKGENHVQLIEGGWATIPNGWLEKYGHRLQRFLKLRDSGKKHTSNIELFNICEDSDLLIPPSLEKLKNSFDEQGKICQYSLPKGLQAILREYQKMGYRWLRFLKDSQMGALLADDMGLGKTLQTISVLEGRCLVVAPTTVIYIWQTEIEKFRPDLKINFYYGKDRKIPSGSGITITSYALLRIDIERFQSIQWDIAVLDEAQSIKNPGSKVAKAAYKIDAQYRIALSGTPIENKLEDLWSLFHFLNPGFLGTQSEFLEEYVCPINRGDKRIQSELHRRLRPFILRRLKHDVEKELPPKTEVVLYCHLDKEERDVYDTILGSTQKEVIEQLQEGGSVFGVLEILLRLRQSCCHVGMIPGEERATSSKIDTLVEHLLLAKESGHRALVFSQWTSFLDLLEPSLKCSDLNFLRIDGSTKNRREVIDQFQNKKEADLMIISLKAGGVGMTLTAADQVYIMDPWWNPAVEEQAADRTHRIGQKNPVFVHRIVAKDTIEERILTLQKKKKNLANAILSGTGESHKITREDIVTLLQ